MTHEDVLRLLAAWDPQGSQADQRIPPLAAKLYPLAKARDPDLARSTCNHMLASGCGYDSHKRWDDLLALLDDIKKIMGKGKTFDDAIEILAKRDAK